MSDIDRPTGHRKMTAGRLRSEFLARGFRGFAPYAPRQAVRIVREYATANLCHAAQRLYTFMLKVCEKSILSCPEEFDFYAHARHFSFFAKNDYITSKTGLQTRTIQRALRQLEDENLIWCNDNGSRNRKIENGICLLPAFCRLAEMIESEEEGQLNLLKNRLDRYQLTKAKAELIALKDIIPLHDMTLVDDLVAIADQAMKGAGNAGFMDTMLLISRSVMELKSLYVAFSGQEMSPHHDNSDTPITYKILHLQKDVEALQGMVSDEVPALVSQKYNEAEITIVAPKPDRLAKGIKALVKHKRFPAVDSGGMSDEAFVRKCGTIASNIISINPRATFLLRAKHGETGAASLLVQAATDPKIRHRAAWAANFAYSEFAEPIDIRGSFYRMIKELDQTQNSSNRDLPQLF